MSPDVGWECHYGMFALGANCCLGSHWCVLQDKFSLTPEFTKSLFKLYPEVAAKYKQVVPAIVSLAACSRRNYLMQGCQMDETTFWRKVVQSKILRRGSLATSDEAAVC